MTKSLQAKTKHLTPEEIENEIYGDGGYYDRVVSEIKNSGLSLSARKIEITTQQLYIFMNSKKDGKFKAKPKLETITKYAKCLGVE